MRWLQRFPYLMAEAGTEGGSGAPPATADPGGTTTTPPPASTAPATPPAAAPPSPPESLDWRHMVPQEYRENPQVTKYKSFAEFVKGSVEGAEYLGRSVQIPKGFDAATFDGTTPEGRAALLPIAKRLGLPEDASGYPAMPPDEQDYAGYSAEDEAAFHRVAHDYQLLPWQVAGLKQFDRTRWKDLANTIAAEHAAADAKGKAELGRMYGANAPHIEAMAASAWELMGQGIWGGPEVGQYLQQKIEQAGLRHDPMLIRGLANLAESLREGEFRGGDFGPKAMSPKDIDARLSTLVTQELSPGGLTAAEQREQKDLYEHKARLTGAAR